MTFPIVTEKKTVIWTVALAVLAFAGNMIGVELFLELKLFFGAMFVMLAVLRFGNPAGLVVAAAAGVACWGECGHVSSVIAVVAEAWFVGRMLRRSSNIVLLDTLFWLVCGMPFVFLSHRFFFGTETSLAVLLMLKQGLNGILMALAAAFVIHFAAFVSFLRRSLVRYAPTMHDVLVTTLVAAILFPGMAYVVLEIRRDSNRAQEEMRQGLESAADLTRELVQIWLNDKVHDVETLASLAGDPQASPPSSIQAQAELMKTSSPHFLSMSVQNAAGVSVAFVPQFNKEGVSNVGKDYSKQPYYHIERQTLRPAVSNVDMGTVNKSPRVALFAPIVREGVFCGYCTGVIEVKRLAEQLTMVSKERRVEITLVDRKRQVVASTDRKLRIMQRVERFHGGDLEWLTGKVYRANLHGEEGHAISSRHAGIFGIESLLSTDVPWSIIVSAPMQPFMMDLYHNASRGLAMLFVLILFSFGAAHAASAAFVRPVAHLERISAALSADIIQHKVIEWPVAGTRDVEGLVTNIREMAETLHDYVNELQVLNESLEQRVLDRTEELRRSEERARAIFMEAGIGIVVADSRRRILDANPATERMLGYSRGELTGKPIADISHPDDEALNLSVVQHTREVGLDVFRMEKRYLRKDGSIVWGNLTVSFLKEKDGESYHTVAMIEDISDRKRAEEEIRQLAYFDSLTGLANRTLFHDRLQQSLARAERQRGVLALLFLDLDRFKDVNDSLGHAYGDLLLARVARRLEGSCRKSDTFARIGGDEFVIIANDCRDERVAVHLAEQILEQVRAPFDLEGKEVFISTSIGIVLYPGDGDDAVSLQKHGDMALYAAKDGGGDQYVFFSPEMNRKALERRIMEDNLRHALQNEELYLEYQPLFDLHSGRPFAVEALLRWEHPTDGLITPDRFIPVAEEIGLIRRIGEWVLRTACRQARVWHDAGLPVQMAVNVSGYQFNQAGFLEMVDQVLAESALPSGLLELELTESTLMEGKRETIATLAALKERGLRLAIDDFGTGYSSLSYLKHFPIDRVKIDRSFVRDIVSVLDDRAIVQAIIAMSHTLGLRVLAEGVELEGELELLKEWGCDEAQGFYFSRPCVAAEMEKFLRKTEPIVPSAAAAAPPPGGPQRP